MNANKKKEPIKLYAHLELNHAKEIITLANKVISRYKISKITGISKGKIKRCLEGYKIKNLKRLIWNNLEKMW